MGYVIWTFRLILIALVAAFLHYTLPGRDVVRIVDTEVRLEEVTGFRSWFFNSSEPTNTGTNNRDVKFISAIRENGKPIVYRNEDTGWGWPPYFKFDSADLQARASDLENASGQQTWALVTHYGWRITLLSIYPNAIDVQRVDGPDHRVIPWFNIIFLIGLLALVLFVWRALRRFRKKRIDPIVRDVAEAFEPREASERGGLTGKPFRGRRERMREWWIEHFG